MSHSVAKDQLAVIRIDGMHCHRCEQAIRKAICAREGVHEVEVDFNSRQASVLFDPTNVKVSDLMAAVDEVGYRAVGFTQVSTDSKT
jgi:copper chaperone CopZ